MEVALATPDAVAGLLRLREALAAVNRWSKERSVPVISGALTPTEIALARSEGSQIVKLFPAAMHGPGYIKAPMEPYPTWRCLR
jgi:2-keto-3-deoxy-6-phosphogluconate aldolase